MHPPGVRTAYALCEKHPPGVRSMRLVRGCNWYGRATAYTPPCLELTTCTDWNYSQLADWLQSG